MARWGRRASERAEQLVREQIALERVQELHGQVVVSAIVVGVNVIAHGLTDDEYVAVTDRGLRYASLVGPSDLVEVPTGRIVSVSIADNDRLREVTNRVCITVTEGDLARHDRFWSEVEMDLDQRRAEGATEDDLSVLAEAAFDRFEVESADERGHVFALAPESPLLEAFKVIQPGIRDS
jgi:hypothetical protein